MQRINPDDGVGVPLQAEPLRLLQQVVMQAGQGVLRANLLWPLAGLLADPRGDFSDTNPVLPGVCAYVPPNLPQGLI